MSALSVLIFAVIYFNEFCEFARFHKIKYANFSFKQIFKNRYMLSMQKIHISFKFKKVFFFRINQ